MKLISNTSFGEFCKSKEKEFPTRNLYLAWYEEIRTNFDKFLKQPLKLEMFVPCDDNANILEEPIFHEPNCENEIGDYEKLIEEYNEAKEKVLFDGFYIEGNKLFYSDFYFGTIYDISNLKVENLLSELPENEMPKLMLSAIKQIGL